MRPGPLKLQKTKILPEKAVAEKASRVKNGWEMHGIKYAIQNYYQLECGSIPNVMAALPNIGGALCSTPQSLADAH